MLLSFLMLFVELVLIRWTASNIVYLAFFTNFVLLASFLGIGVGFLRAHRRRDRFPLAPAALALVVAFVTVFSVEVRRLGEGSLQGHFGLPALPQWVVLPIVFLGSAAVMALIAEGVARTFARFEPLEAYRLDILGSLAGISAFSVLSFLGAPPVVWGLAIAVVFLVLGEASPRQRAALAAVVALLGIHSFVPGQAWSPYYKVVATGPLPDRTVRIRVNNIPHQAIHPIGRLVERYPFYRFTYDRIAGNPLEDVLVVGAGNGNDVALALRQGAERVDAVEIDPVIQKLGATHHPDRPYDDSRVEVHIDDGRAFLERTDRRYDLILFALPDSLTLVGGTAIRLESYLFTVEAFEEVREHLNPGGAFSAYNYYRPVVFRRYAHQLDLVFGRPPCVDRGQEQGRRTQAVMTVGVDGDAIRCASPLQETAAPPEPATDDHPFPYLQGRAIPSNYLWALGLVLASSVGLVRAASGRLARMRGYLDLFFMGAAFLLLETKNVVQFALLFGTTWFVNALVFAGILLAVLGAIEVARRSRLPRPAFLYAALGAALAVAFVVPSQALLALPVAPRFVAATALAFAPVFLANVIFAQRFRDVGSSVVAFGANLLGAMVGGVLEYGSLVVGFRGLLLWAAALYGLAFLFGRRHLRPS
ncbi:MAG TPA: spermidine synthase [Actinomycetota bacterium]|nr:spermidine synthase [Actinomycetota bacterium]